MTNQDILRMAREAVEDAKLPFSKPEHPISMSAFCESLAMQVAAAEREACAKVLDRMAENDKLSNYFKVAALAIRERSAL
jgi:hypothetical protein